MIFVQIEQFDSDFEHLLNNKFNYILIQLVAWFESGIQARDFIVTPLLSYVKYSEFL